MNAARIVTVTVRRVYGMPVIYPADANARAFSAIAGTKTITPAMLRHIRALGFDVNEKTEPAATLQEVNQ
jgi:hypothetical protein